MQAEKPGGKVRVTSDKRLAEHARAIEQQLASPEILKELHDRFPDAKSIEVVKGKSFQVQGVNPASKSLKVMVNPSKAKATGQAFGKRFRPKQVKEADPAKKAAKDLRHRGLRDLDVLDAAMPEAGYKPPTSDFARVVIPTANTGEIPLSMPVSRDQLTELLSGRLDVADLMGKFDDAFMRREGKKAPDRRTVEWPEVAVPDEDGRGLAYSELHESQVPPRKVMRDWHESWYSGSYVRGDGYVKHTQVGKPMGDMEEVNLFWVKATPETTSYIFDQPFKHDHKNDRVAVPIIGGFIGKEGDITNELEEKGVIERVKDDEGRPVTVPVFVKTARQFFQPMGHTRGCRVRLFKVGDRVIIPNTVEAVEEVWSSLGPDGVDFLRGFTVETLRMNHQMDRETEPFETYAQRMYGHALVKIGNDLIGKLKQQNERKPGSVRKLELDKVQYHSFDIVGYGIKGGGCMKYTGNHISAKGSGDVPERFRFREMTGDDSAFVVDRKLENSQGIIMSIPHQEWVGNPVGGDSVENYLCFERENKLLQHGGKLSYITSAVIPLLSRDEVPELSTNRIAMVYNAVLDDTRRIDDFLDADIPRTVRKGMFRSAIGQKYDADETEASIDEKMDEHWIKMAANIGANINAMYEADLNNPSNRGMAGNLSIDGGLCDSMDFAHIRESREFHSTIAHTIMPLEEFYRVSGLKGNFYQSKYFRIMADKMLGQERAQALTEEIGKIYRPGAPGAMGSRNGKAIGLLTDAFLEGKNEQVDSVWKKDDMQFIALVNADEDLKGKLKLKHDLSAGASKDNLMRLRSFSDLYLRTEKAMTIRDMVAERKAEFAQKFPDLAA
ncbi:hypothetical protein ACFLRF_03600 [Candidatus Altiarchaeota archaeon]